jgi:hypothetical protein
VKLAAKQQGLSLISTAIIMIMIGFFIMCAIRMGPRYMEYLTIRSVIETVISEPGARQLGASGLRRAIENRFITNQIDVIDPRSDIVIKRENGKIMIDAGYESRLHIAWIIDAVMVFDDMVFIVGEPLD